MTQFRMPEPTHKYFELFFFFLEARKNKNMVIRIVDQMFIWLKMYMPTQVPLNSKMALCILPTFFFLSI